MFRPDQVPAQLILTCASRAPSPWYPREIALPDYFHNEGISVPRAAMDHFCESLKQGRKKAPDKVKAL
jgi:hypothetical protein